MSVEFFVNVIGWIAAGSVLAAYALVSTERVRSASYLYHGLNLIGGAGLTVNTFYYMSYPSAALNVVWAVIAVYAIWHLIAASRREDAPADRPGE